MGKVYTYKCLHYKICEISNIIVSYEIRKTQKLAKEINAYNLLNFDQENINHIKRCKIKNNFETIVSLPTKVSQRAKVFAFYETSKKKQTPIFLKVLFVTSEFY